MGALSAPTLLFWGRFLGKLFGAVTNKEISEGLKAQYGVDIPKQKIVLDEPIKAYGSYQVKAKLGFEVSGTVYVTVCEEK